MYSKWRGLCGILSLAGSLTLLGCGVNGNSYVRVVNASPGLANYTVIAGQTPIVSSIPYGTEGVQQQGNYSTADTSGNYRPLGSGNGQSLYVYSTPGTNLASTTKIINIKPTRLLDGALELALTDNHVPTGESVFDPRPCRCRDVVLRRSSFFIKCSARRRRRQLTLD